MKTFTVFVGLGSNLGDRHKQLLAAAREVKALPGAKYIWSSSVYETDPYGKQEQGKFLNAVLQIETTMEPAELLKELKSIEARLGRTPGERWGPREIDLDILLYEGFTYHDETVQVPHPDLENRRFVLVPLREIAADVVHPVSGMTMGELANASADRGKVIMTSYRINV
jgi:2-amino-4-hydroxy-6-hydroxymethyldihydropteridine diphosphokinase